MQSPNFDLTICGLADLDYHSSRGVTHVLSILDPEWPEPESFGAYDPHHRLTLRFDDAIEPGPELKLPTRDDVQAIVDFGRRMIADVASDPCHLLVHCHAGVSRSTAAVAVLLAQQSPQRDETEVLDQLIRLRPQAWPNSLMIAFGDELLERGGRLSAALGKLYARQLRRDPHAKRLFRALGRGREVRMGLGAISEGLDQ